MQILLPKQVKKIIHILEEHGYEGYAVGGCVRDSILGRTPNDWDITTSAKPGEIKELFKRTVDTGIEHGTVTVLLDGEGYEVTTYRLDGEYEDGRHPKEVIFTENLVEDLKRRDFTINAMAYNDACGLVDAFEGEEDLKRGVIRCVGEAKERFSEDALRILRAVRFSAQLGFAIGRDTAEAIKLLAENLEHISAERIQTELVKLLVSPHPEYLGIAYELGITAVILPEFDEIMQTPQNNPRHICGVGEHTLEALKNVPADKVLRLAVLFHDFGKPQTRLTDPEGMDQFEGHADLGAVIANRILRRLKFDKDSIRKVTSLVRFHSWHPVITGEAIRKMIYRSGEDIFPLLLQVQKADALAKEPKAGKARLELIQKAGQTYGEILERKDCLSLKTLAVKGKDLIQDGMRPGKEIGGVLESLLCHVLEEPEHNTREYLMEYSKTVR